MAEVEFHIGMCRWTCHQKDCVTGPEVATRYTTKAKATILALAHAQSAHFGDLDLATPNECLAMGKFSDTLSSVSVNGATTVLQYWSLWRT